MKIPQSEILSTGRMNRIFDNTVATYKFYWFASILGLFVTSGTFSPAAKQEAITSKEYVKLIGDELITLWQQYYTKMSDEDKNRLPLRYIAFLGSNE